MARWNIVRLELGPVAGFPNGSPIRFYLLRLPLSQDGLIDEAECAREPRMATVRRFWPNEADLSSYIIRSSLGWASSSARPNEDHQIVFELEDRPIKVGECLPVFDAGGIRRSYRIVSVETD